MTTYDNILGKVAGLPAQIGRLVSGLSELSKKKQWRGYKAN